MTAASSLPVWATAAYVYMSSTALLLLLLLFSGSPQHLTQAFVVPSSTSTSHVNRPSFVRAAETYAKSLMRQQQQQQQQQQYRHHHHIVLYMGWGPDPIWSTATVQSNVDACPSSKSCLVQVQVPAETAAEYKVPGQYVQMRPNNDAGDTKPLFLAMASPPSAATSTASDENTNKNDMFEFLIKKTDGNEWLTTLQAGAAVEISQVLGNGYPLEENLEGFKYDFPTQNILLLAAGSGIAPLKAAIESNQLLLKEGSDISGTRTCRLYYGEQTADDLCFTNQFADWEQMGVQVVPVLSQPGPEWQGREGYVQTALEEDGVAVPRNTGALICGMKGMAEASKELLTNAGVFEGRILFNF